MFQGIPQGASQIAQGATLYILNRKDFSVSLASVTNVSQPHVSKAAQTNPALVMQGFVIDVFINVGNESTSIEFPVNNSSANYPDKGWFVSPDRLLVTREIEAMETNSKQFVAQKPWHEMVISKAPSLIMQLNPEKKVEAEQAQKITQLEAQLSEMNGRLEQMVGLLSAGIPRNATKPKKEE